MSKLIEVLQAFDLRKTTADTIHEEFKKIADVALNEGYFLVKLDERSKKIYPVEIEFYIYGEKESDQTEEKKWMCDYNMLHRHYDGINRKNVYTDEDENDKKYVDYFPDEGSLYPHKYGVDVTFESKKRQYRASFLIKKYRIDNPKGEIQKKATYLSEEIFGYAPFGTDGLHLEIKWIDDPTVRTGISGWKPRENFHKKNKELDDKRWRCIKADW